LRRSAGRMFTAQGSLCLHSGFTTPATTSVNAGSRIYPNLFQFRHPLSLADAECGSEKATLCDPTEVPPSPLGNAESGSLLNEHRRARRYLENRQVGPAPPFGVTRLGGPSHMIWSRNLFMFDRTRGAFHPQRSAPAFGELMSPAGFQFPGSVLGWLDTFLTAR